MRMLRVGLRLSLAARPRASAGSIFLLAGGTASTSQFAARNRPYQSIASGSPAPLARSYATKPSTETAKPGATAATNSSGAEATKAEASQQLKETRDVATMEKKEKQEKQEKLTAWQKVKKEARHYWEGTKLLGYEVKISTKLAFKLASGRELSRREDRQLKRTVQDIVRLVPFSVFVLVPFAELLLPIALKIFPNLLPSTYETSNSRNAKSKKLGATRRDVGSYLRDSIQHTRKGMAVPNFSSDQQRLDFEEFFRQAREGEKPSKELTIKVARMFKDDMLLDNLSRPQLAAVARYMGIQPFGTSIILRYQIRHKMRLIKQDDRIIDYEGVDSLNSLELQTACQSRGFRTIGVSTGRLRDDLSNWLQLRLHDRVPSTLLVLSSAYTYGDHNLETSYDAILSVLSSLPPEVYHETELELNSDGATNAQRLEVLKEQDELIREENKEEQESGHVVQVRDNLNVDDEEKAPPQPTESEADAKADLAWYDNAEKTEEEASRNPKPNPTDSEVDAKADAEWYEAADRKAVANSQEETDASRNPKPNPTDSEVDAKADAEWYQAADRKADEARQDEIDASRNPKSNPTDSELDAKADSEWYEAADRNAAESGAEENKASRNPKPEPTVSESDSKADQAWYNKSQKS